MVVVPAIQITGFEDVNDFAMDKIISGANDLADRCMKIFGKNSILEFKIVAGKKRKRENIKYDIKANLFTTVGNFYALESGWEVLNVVQEVLSELERQLIEKKEMIKE